jgi:hypothetical protein
VTAPGVRVLLLFLAAAVLAPAWSGSRAAAQTPPSWRSHVTASVTVAPPPILLEDTRDLHFGNVGPGQVVSVPARPPYDAGTWSAGVRFSNLRKTVRYGVHLTLPAALTNGTVQMPVSWSGTQYGWICVWNATTHTADSCNVQQQTFSPDAHTSAGTAIVIDLPNNTPQNNVFAADVYVGGQLTVPSGSLVPGVYTAPLTATIFILN